MTYIIFLVGYAIGIVVAIILMRPMKSWQEGYDSAKEMYSDWNKGFDVGFSAAREHFTDYGLGFKEGWNARDERCRKEQSANEF